MSNKKPGGGNRPLIGGGQAASRTAGPLLDYFQHERHINSTTPIISGRKAALIIVVCFAAIFVGTILMK